MKCYNLRENVDFQTNLRYYIERRLHREIRNNKQEVAKDDSNEYRNYDDPDYDCLLVKGIKR